MSASNLLQRDIDASAAAIKSIKALAYKLQQTSEQQRVQLEELQANVRTLFERDLFRDNERIRAALDRLEAGLRQRHEYRNMAEYGAFQIQISNLMDDAWQQLPG